MHRFVVLFVGCLVVACWVVGGFDCAIVFVVLEDAQRLLLSPCNTCTEEAATQHPARSQPNQAYQHRNHGLVSVKQKLPPNARCHRTPAQIWSRPHEERARSSRTYTSNHVHVQHQKSSAVLKLFHGHASLDAGYHTETCQLDADSRESCTAHIWRHGHHGNKLQLGTKDKHARDGSLLPCDGCICIDERV